MFSISHSSFCCPKIRRQTDESRTVPCAPTSCRHRLRHWLSENHASSSHPVPAVQRPVSCVLRSEAWAQAEGLQDIGVFRSSGSGHLSVVLSETVAVSKKDTQAVSTLGCKRHSSRLPRLTLVLPSLMDEPCGWRRGWGCRKLCLQAVYKRTVSCVQQGSLHRMRSRVPTPQGHLTLLKGH